MLPLVLVVAADRQQAARLRSELEGAGIKAYYVETLTSALGVAAQWRFDAVLVAGRGFGDAVFDMLRSLRRSLGTPIVLVADDHDDADADEERQLRALDAGASQVLAGSASPRIVVAQLRSLADVSAAAPPGERSAVSFGPLRLDPRSALASVGNTLIGLTRGEFELLLLLAARPGELVHRRTIARTLGSASDGDPRRSADMHVCRLRRKLKDAGADPLRIETVYGRGYLLRLAPAPDAADESCTLEWSA